MAPPLPVSLVKRHGEDVGRIYDPMCIYGGQVIYPYQFLVEQAFGERRSLKLDRVSADTDSVIPGGKGGETAKRRSVLPGSVKGIPRRPMGKEGGTR